MRLEKYEAAGYTAYFEKISRVAAVIATLRSEFPQPTDAELAAKIVAQQKAGRFGKLHGPLGSSQSDRINSGVLSEKQQVLNRINAELPKRLGFPGRLELHQLELMSEAALREGSDEVRLGATRP